MSRLLLSAALQVVFYSVLPLAGNAESFDKPAKQIVVNLGRSKYLMPNNPERVRLSCFYYPGFMIKQLDDPGLKGAAWITLTPIMKGGLPACRRSHGAAERFLDREHFGGYFKGVKGELVFLDAADGLNGATTFRVVDWKTGKTLFEDSALFWDGHRLRDNVQFARDPSGALVLHYRRSVETACSIAKDGASCWKSIRQKFRLHPSGIPKCTGYKGPGVPEWTPEHPVVPPEDLDTPSVVAYPVAVTLFPHAVTKSIPGKVSCNASE